MKKTVALSMAVFCAAVCSAYAADKSGAVFYVNDKGQIVTPQNVMTPIPAAQLGNEMDAAKKLAKKLSRFDCVGEARKLTIFACRETASEEVQVFAINALMGAVRNNKLSPNWASAFMAEIAVKSKSVQIGKMTVKLLLSDGFYKWFDEDSVTVRYYLESISELGLQMPSLRAVIINKLLAQRAKYVASQTENEYSYYGRYYGEIAALDEYLRMLRTKK